MDPWRTGQGDRQANGSIKHPGWQFEPTSGCRTVHTTPQRAYQPLLDDVMNVDRHPKPGMPWVENFPPLRHMGVVLSPSTTRCDRIRALALGRQIKPTSTTCHWMWQHEFRCRWGRHAGRATPAPREAPNGNSRQQSAGDPLIGSETLFEQSQRPLSDRLASRMGTCFWSISDSS